MSTIKLDRETTRDLAVWLETMGPSIAYDAARNDAAGYASELRGALSERAGSLDTPRLIADIEETRAESEAIIYQRLEGALAHLSRLDRAFEELRKRFGSGCVGNTDNLGSPALVIAAQSELTEPDR